MIHPRPLPPLDLSPFIRVDMNPHPGPRKRRSVLSRLWDSLAALFLVAGTAAAAVAAVFAVLALLITAMVLATIQAILTAPFVLGGKLIEARRARWYP